MTHRNAHPATGTDRVFSPSGIKYTWQAGSIGQLQLGGCMSPGVFEMLRVPSTCTYMGRQHPAYV